MAATFETVVLPLHSLFQRITFGLIIAAATIPAVLLWARPGVLVFASLWCLVGMGLVGLYDDWLKVRHGSSDGISARFKLAGQGFVALTAFGIVLLDPAYREGLAEIWLPVLKEPLWSAGSLGWPLAACLAVAGGFFILVCVGCSNAVTSPTAWTGWPSCRPCWLLRRWACSPPSRTCACWKCR